MVIAVCGRALSCCKITSFRLAKAGYLSLKTLSNFSNCAQYTSLVIVWLDGKSSKRRIPLKFHETHNFSCMQVWFWCGLQCVTFIQPLRSPLQINVEHPFFSLVTFVSKTASGFDMTEVICKLWFFDCNCFWSFRVELTF